MGRGRQKAKQTKVARKLKYYSPETDYEALQRELQAAQRRELQEARQKEEALQRDQESDHEVEDWRLQDIPPAI